MSTKATIYIDIFLFFLQGEMLSFLFAIVLDSLLVPRPTTRPTSPLFQLRKIQRKTKTNTEGFVRPERKNTVSVVRRQPSTPGLVP